MSSTSTSQDLTSNADSQDSIARNENKGSAKGLRKAKGFNGKEAAISRDILLFLIAFRILNALSIKTFFQPDEFFQSLDPAWEIAFGPESGAWISWEWKNKLRSSIHPVIFAGVYWLSSCLSNILSLSPDSHADLLVATPKILQALVAAVGDFYTYKLGERIYGRGSYEAWTSLALTVCSPWQWFCSTRTLSNCLETSLTVVALYLWPWQWSLNSAEDEESDDNSQSKEDAQFSAERLRFANRLRCCLVLAALACILRPTNVLIWICVAYSSLFRPATDGTLIPFRWADLLVWIHISSSAPFPAPQKERKTLFQEAFLCGTSMLALSTVIDRLYYQQWAFPPLQFIYFNGVQSLAVFYGRNDWHYYLSQGYPLLLTTYLPFAIIGLYRSLINNQSSISRPFLPCLTATMNYQLALTSLFVPIVLSFISHKEVRFIYPLLPFLHVLASAPFAKFFVPSFSTPFPSPRRLLLLFIILANISIAYFSTTLHQTAPLTTLAYLRTQHTLHYLSQPPRHSIAPAPSIMTVGFLVPCHSTPWRSHLIHRGIKAWALTCEPPVNLNATARELYLDEADQFYADPATFLATNLGKPPPKSPFIGRPPPAQALRYELSKTQGWDGGEGRKRWPEYLVFFAQLEPEMKRLLAGSAYVECWRGWNSWFHDDWRRRGDMVVWCLSRKEKVKEGVGKREGSMWTWEL